MSLTREQWEEVWRSIKEIEKDARSLKVSTWQRESILEEVKFIKEKIESVVGQQE